MISERDAGIELGLQKITFVEEEDYTSICEQLVGDDGAPEKHRIFKPVDPWVFGEGLIESGDRCKEDDCIDVGKVWCPRLNRGQRWTDEIQESGDGKYPKHTHTCLCCRAPPTS